MWIRFALVFAIVVVAGVAVAVGSLPGSGAQAGSGGSTPSPTGPTGSAELPLAGKTIAVDPGHNGGNGAHPRAINRMVPAGGFRKACDTTGTATNDGSLSEPAFTWSVANRLKRVLE